MIQSERTEPDASEPLLERAAERTAPTPRERYALRELREAIGESESVHGRVVLTARRRKQRWLLGGSFLAVLVVCGGALYLNGWEGFAYAVAGTVASGLFCMFATFEMLRANPDYAARMYAISVAAKTGERRTMTATN